MPLGNDDLLPLFQSEASGRLNRLDEVLAKGSPDPDGELWRIARRELHTLKGAARMMGLTEIAEVCHQAEDVIDWPAEDGFEILLGLIKRVRTMVGTIGVIEGSAGGEPVNGTQEVPSLVVPQAQPSLDTRILDRVSDQAVHLSFLSREIGAMVEALHAMARTAESGVTDGQPEQVLATLALSLRRAALSAGQAHSRFDGLLEQQLGSLLSIQVQPVRPLLSSLGNHAVELGLSLGKTVAAEVESAHCRLDRRIMDALRQALLHVVRNAVDHGIEPETERMELGKNPTGTVALRAETRAERVRLVVSDDGRGINPQEVLAKAVERGLVSKEAAEALEEDGIRQLLFHSGFSMRDQTTEVSGRGIGLDTVADTVRRIGGDVWIDAVPGEGTQITIDLPVSRRGEPILVVEAGGYKVGIPAHQVRAFGGSGVARDSGAGGAAPSDGVAVSVELSTRFGLAPAENGSTVVHAKSVGIPVDLVVDRVIGEEEVFLHSWPKFLGRIPGTEAMALLAEGVPIAVLDLQFFIQPTAGEPQAFATSSAEFPPLKVLLVDDSRITREMFRRILADGGVEIILAASGEEALGVLDDRTVDCIVTDIEMPGIDGLELTRRVRASSEWEHLPVVVVSTRNQPSDRMAGLEAGADAYLAKQNMMGEELLTLVERLGGRR
ncbi:MAG: hypothetical protein DRJ65_00495 [Acidobacteria bacterium]|nr:MAG: hypothetical protein DRJ65_00495 [Acidobacteriota bacterium]